MLCNAIEYIGTMARRYSNGKSIGNPSRGRRQGDSVASTPLGEVGSTSGARDDIREASQSPITRANDDHIAATNDPHVDLNDDHIAATNDPHVDLDPRINSTEYISPTIDTASSHVSVLPSLFYGPDGT